MPNRRADNPPDLERPTSAPGPEAHGDRPGDGPLLDLGEIRRTDIEAARIVLDGRSIVDASHMPFQDEAEVVRFLRLLCYDVDEPTDRAHLVRLLRDSAEHLAGTLGVGMPDELLTLEDPIAPFLWASQPGPLFQPALMVLKISHVLKHIEARELRYRLSVSENELFALAEERIRLFGEDLRNAGVDVVLMHASEKSWPSTILKLLAKRQATAAQIYDRMRFRVILRHREDVLPTLLLMTRTLFPFNYVVPGESRNDLAPFRLLLEQLERRLPPQPALQEALRRERGSAPPQHVNEFSHPDFQMLNFVVDLPLRVDRYADRIREAGPAIPEGGLGSALDRYGRVVFLLVELQIYDLETFLDNEAGPGSHAHYKARQRRTILRRLAGEAAVEAWRTPRLP